MKKEMLRKTSAGNTKIVVYARDGVNTAKPPLIKITHYRNNKQDYLDRALNRNARVKTENRQRLYAYLSEHPCVDCGVTDVRVLEFDHVRGNKSANIAGLLNNAVSWSTIEKEIAKCEVRCANCHRIKTNERGSWWRFGRTLP